MDFVLVVLLTTHEKKQERHPDGLACKSCKRKMREKKCSRACSVTNNCPCFGPDGFAILEKCTGGPYGRWNFGVLVSALMGWHAVTHPDIYTTIIPSKKKNVASTTRIENISSVNYNFVKTHANHSKKNHLNSKKNHTCR